MAISCGNLLICDLVPVIATALAGFAMTGKLVTLCVCLTPYTATHHFKGMLPRNMPSFYHRLNCFAIRCTTSAQRFAAIASKVG